MLHVPLTHTHKTPPKKGISRVWKVSVIEYVQKTKQDIITSEISPDRLFGKVLHSQRCVCVCVRAPTWTLWAVFILRGMAAAFRWACFRLISLTSRQAIWDTEMCYQRATLMACSDTSLHARCISDTSPYLPRVQSQQATSHTVESVKEKGSVKNKMMIP